MDISMESNCSEGSPKKKGNRPKKRSLVERELETNLTSKITSPINNDKCSTSRYGRSRRHASDANQSLNNSMKSPSPIKKFVKQVQSPLKIKESPIKNNLEKENQIQNKNQKNVKDLKQSPVKVSQKKAHLNNSLEKNDDQNSSLAEPSTSEIKDIYFGLNKKGKRKSTKITSEPELNDLEKACVFQIGDIAWARIGSYPFWPCIVCRDPFTEVFVKMQAKGKVEVRYIHVLFFGDGQRGWIQENNLHQYLGLQQFLDARNDLSSEVKKKDPKLYAAYFVPEKQIVKWKKSVDEADMLLKEPQILRLEIYNDILIAKQNAKITPKKDKPAKVTRKSSDVSLSESLYDSLFSEDVNNIDEIEPSKRKQKKSPIDVSKVVSACLDNMAAKTGITKIQKESHMDRWLQKAKSKTPEKSQVKKKPIKNNPPETKEKPDEIVGKKKLQKNFNLNPNKSIKTPTKGKETNFKPYIENGFGIGYITKVQSLTDAEHESIVENNVEQNVCIDGEVYLVNNDVCDEVVLDEINGNVSSYEDNSDIILDGRSTPPECIITHNKSTASTDYSQSGEIDISDDEKELIIVNSKQSEHVILYTNDKNQDIENNSKIANAGSNSPCRKNVFENHIQNRGDLSIEKTNSKDEKCLVVTDKSEKNSIEPSINGSSSSSFSNLESDKVTCSNFNNEADSVNLLREDMVENLLDDLIIDDNIKDLKPEYDNRDFIKYVQSKKDTIMDENPELSHREILEYLYNTWSYEYLKSGGNIEGKKVHNTRRRNDLNNISAENIFRESDKQLILIEQTKKSNDKAKNGSLKTKYENKKRDKVKKTRKEIINGILETEEKEKDESNFKMNGTLSDVVHKDDDILMNQSTSEEKDLDKINIKEISTPDICSNKSKTEPAINGLNLVDTSDINVKGLEADVISNDQHDIIVDIRHDDVIPINTDSTINYTEKTIPNFTTNHDENNLSVEEKNSSSDKEIMHVSNRNDDNLNIECSKSDATPIDEEEIDETVNEFNKYKNDADFLKYVKKKRPAVMEEKPELFEHELLLYLYKEWRLKRDNMSKNTDQINHIEKIDSTLNNSNFDKISNVPSKVNKSPEKPISDGSNESNLSKCDSPLPLISHMNIPNGNIICNRASGINKLSSYSNDIEFLKYVESKQDNIFEEHPDLSETDVLNYLYKTWRYEHDYLQKDEKIDYLKDTITVKDISQTENQKVKQINTENKILNNITSKAKDIEPAREVLSSKTENENNKQPVDKSKLHDDLNHIEGPKNENTHKDIENNVSSSYDQVEICEKTNLELCIEVPVKLKESKNDGNSSKLKACYNNPHFIQYVELKQDVIIDENPDLSEEAILEYLYDTWKYEEELKTQEMKDEEIKQNNLVKGSEQKEELKSNELHQSKNEDQSVAEIPLLEDKLDKSDDQQQSKHAKTHIAETKLIISLKKSPVKNSKSTLDSWLINTKSISQKYNSPSICNTISDAPTDVQQIKETTDSENKFKHEKSDKSKKEYKNKKNKYKIDNYNTTNKAASTINNVDVLENDPLENLIDFDKCIPEHITDKSNSKYQDPEFLKYLELRQDVVIDDYPDLSKDDILVYLYKTWSYEEKLKSDERKNDDIHQSKLVKGLGEQVAPVATKRVYRKKAKLEKSSDSDDFEYHKDKPARKQVVKPYYNELEDFSDSDDEFLDYTKQQIEKTITGEGIQIEGQVFNEVEYFLHQMTLPKPNVFKGLIREKVCEICEKPNDLIKCKNCLEMFHYECATKPDKIEEVFTPLKLKKKKRGRKPKHDSGDDVSFDDNEKFGGEIDTIDISMSVDDFENKFEEKMKELLKDDDSLDLYEYTSDEEIDWRNSVPGKCEIINVKNKTKVVGNVENFKCKNCQKYNVPLCFVCKEAVSPKNKIEFRQRCNVAHCTKYYHLECLDHWPQTQLSTKAYTKNGGVGDVITCPRHVCHTCVCDDPRGCKTRFSADKLAKCVRCPAVYHSFTKCLPAGSQILNASNVICPRHYELKPGKVPCHVNTGWCFICALGGTLICCEYCPTSFHAECLNIKPPEGNYMCEDCETGRLPLYGEMVWVKLGHYRWWPGLILHPNEIPENVMAIKHYFGEFVVRFFGQYDHYWVNRGRVFPFQEGDTGKISSTKSKIDAAFSRAIEDAYKACEVMKTVKPNEEESHDIASSLIAPHYVKLKVNKPYGALVNWKPDDIEADSMTQCECDPNEFEPCGPNSHCLNRILATECGPYCKSGDRCCNRNFEKRNYPKMTPYRTAHRGWGLKTLVDIQKGQFIIEYVGELIDDEEIQRRMKRKHEIRDENYYFLTLDKDRTIDAGPKGNLSRFMNHSCQPNCETQKWTVLGDVRVGLFAIQDIPANSELTFNYHFECAGMEKKQCMCGAKLCAGFMGAKVKQLEYQPKRPKTEKGNKKTQKKNKKGLESPSTPKRRGRKRKTEQPKELTEIEKDLLIIKSATESINTEIDTILTTEENLEAVKDSIESVLGEADKDSVKTVNVETVSVKNENVKVSKRKMSEETAKVLPVGKKVKIDNDLVDIKI